MSNVEASQFTQTSAPGVLRGILQPRRISADPRKATSEQAKAVYDEYLARLNANARSLTHALDSGSIVSQALYFDDRLRWILQRVQAGVAAASEKEGVSALLQGTGKVAEALERWQKLNGGDMSPIEELRATGSQLASALASPALASPAESLEATPQIAPIEGDSGPNFIDPNHLYVEAERIEEPEIPARAGLSLGAFLVIGVAFILITRD